ncbi:MAG: ArgE/DapE family deacylase [Blastocatellia bacterium]|nr:ArgE/DapE family deacylase [Blastocatellia bacterium]MCS7156472.1 ArgE/DapE family deacylase [Blastocatellia bacterium]MCX7751787.1 ArgE/DapE family deacylase [Blastocatellia bacterium]MDW8256649.1 ArgE/DapE family deacylase [Acidobacteriota bacterium]
MREWTIQLLRDLVAINSVNPSLVSDGAGEREIAEQVAMTLRRLGLDVEVAAVAPHRPNVVAVLEGRAPGRSLMWCGHLDTVGVMGMDAPFEPREKEGRLYGRGALDMKGGLAAMIGAARALAQKGGMLRGRVILAAVIDEEYASLGAEALVKAWRADAAVILEPTDLQIGIAHKGFAWIEVVTTGIAAHGSRPHEGRDAILRMGRVLQRLESLDRRLQAQPPHPLLGTASLHASLIRGGRELSTYPDECVLQMERRTLAGEPPGAALREVEELLDEARREDAEFVAHARLLFERPPYAISPDHELLRQLGTALTRIGRSPSYVGLSFWTDAAILGRAGIPTVVFGPGGAGLHGLEEYVNVDDVLTCVRVLTELADLFNA